MNDRCHWGSNSGLSLIEVAVAFGLLGLVLTAALAATGTGLRAWLTAREATARDRREANWTDQLHAAIAGMIPIEARSDPARIAGQVFFQGAPRGMRFVTAHSPTSGGRDGIRLVEVRAVPFGRRVELVLRDAPCPSALALGALLAVPIEGPRSSQTNRALESGLGRGPSRVIADGLSKCEFRYRSQPVGPGGNSKWVSRWEDRHATPRAVRIEWIAGNGASPGRRVAITAAVVAGTRRAR